MLIAFEKLLIDMVEFSPTVSQPHYLGRSHAPQRLVQKGRKLPNLSQLPRLPDKGSEGGQLIRPPDFASRRSRSVPSRCCQRCCQTADLSGGGWGTASDRSLPPAKTVSARMAAAMRGRRLVQWLLSYTAMILIDAAVIVAVVDTV